MYLLIFEDGSALRKKEITKEDISSMGDGYLSIYEFRDGTIFDVYDGSEVPENFS